MMETERRHEHEHSFWGRLHYLFDLLRELGEIIHLPPIPHCEATKIILALPEIYQGGILMANLQLKNDQVMAIGILTIDNMGTVVPAPAGDVFTVTSSNPASLNCVIGTMASGAPAVIINALVQASPGLSFEIADSSGLAVFDEGVDIVEDFTPAATGLDIANAEVSAQPVPTAVGP
jgi:hypothetical protein